MRKEDVELTGVAQDQFQAEVDTEQQAWEETGGHGGAEAVAGEDAGAEAPYRERPDGETDPLGEAGWYLEQERLARGLTLEQAGEATGVHPYHLEAIEFGDLTCLPERLQALEMIAAYAYFLGFDPEPLVEHFSYYMPAPQPAPQQWHPANPPPFSSAKILAFGRRLQALPRFNFRPVLDRVIARMPGGAGGLVASAAGAVMLFAAASYMLMPGSDPAPVAAEEQAAPQVTGAADTTADPMPTASTGAESADVKVAEQAMPDAEAPAAAAAAPANQDDLAGTGLNGISSLIQENVPASGEGVKPAVNLNADVAMTNDGREFGSGNAESRLTLKAKAPVWVRIEDSHGNVVMTQMLMKGDTYRVPNREGLVVIARDGGLLSYMIDGQEKGILGTPGEILVGRSLDLKSFEG